MTITTAPETIDYAAQGWTIESEVLTFAAGAGPELAGTTATRWRAVHNGRTMFAGWETEAGVTAAVVDHCRDFVPTRVEFADGTVLDDVPAWAARAARGIDHEGLLVVEFPGLEGMTYALTGCCYASAKGSGSGVVCRACYDEVPDRLGSQTAPLFAVVPGR